MWVSATESSKDSPDAGSVARLHSSLMGLLSHLVRRLTSLGMDHPQIAQVMPFLLRHALDLSHPESNVLVEDGLQLLQIVLKRSDQLLADFRVRPLATLNRQETLQVPWLVKAAYAFNLIKAVIVLILTGRFW